MPTQEELDFFEEKREGLEMLYDGKFVLIKGRKLIGAYDHQDDVFKEYGLRFSDTGCLIRYIGDEKNVGQ